MPSSTPMPTPKIVTQSDGALRFAVKDFCMQSHGAVAEPAGRWLGACLRRDFGVVLREPDGARQPAVHLGLIDDLARLGLAQPKWSASQAFTGPVACEQGYVIRVTPQSLVLAARHPFGLQHGCATALQLLRRTGAQVAAPCCRIEDWPDLRFRVGADWLLNAEVNRWGYERGDGRDATIARMKRKLDLAARYKINVVWFDGFGWDPERRPGYADFARELAAYASERCIRLAHAGYGGGYGFAYQQSQLYSAPYQGRVFENRVSYPDGEVYDCVGEPSYPTSWRYGTCLSNGALAGEKLAELVRFVRECRPGLLYIHDIDAGFYEAAHKGWQRRCAQCWQRWPDDDMASENGAAGAYASWFRQLAEAVNAVRSDDGRYVAERDCELVFVGPLYTACEEPDETWSAACDYFEAVSRLARPFPNVQFGIREQFVSDNPPEPRVAMLKRRLEAAGSGHGVFVVAFAGGDKYYSDQLVAPAPALQRCYEGADTVYTAAFGSVAEPAQVLCAEYAWNANAPGAYEPAVSRNEALERLNRCRSGVETAAAVLGPQGALRRACDLLYGVHAGLWMQELFSLGHGQGVFPLATGWGAATREVNELLNGSPEPQEDRVAHWRRRERLTVKAVSLVETALREPLPDTDVRADLEWLQKSLAIGSRLCRALAACRQWRRDSGEAAHDAARDAVDELAAFVRDNVPTDTVDPVGGDVAAWLQTVEGLGRLLK